MNNLIEFLKPGHRYKYIGPTFGYFTTGCIYEVPPDDIPKRFGTNYSYIQVNAGSTGYNDTFKGLSLTGFGAGYQFQGQKRFKDVFIDVTIRGHLPKWL